MSSHRILTVLGWLLGLSSFCTTAFAPSLRSLPFLPRCTTPTTLSAGGFGGDSKQRKEAKLKPKQQWDKYLDLKKELKVRVAVRVSSGDEPSEWMEVGHVKSKENGFTEIAVARQRALIADHARRLYPLTVSLKDRVEWAYWNDSAGGWKMVDKTVLEASEIPEGLEKNIGFEGTPHPPSGYYCYYNEGKLVNDPNEMDRPAKKLL